MPSTILTAILKLRDDMTGRLRKVGSAVRSISRGMVNSFRAVKASVFNLRNALVAVAAVAAAKVAADFEKSMSQITGLVGIAEDKVSDFSEQILELGAKVGKGPRELADAMFFITSAGLRGAEAMEALDASARAAAAGLGETKIVADAVTSAMNAYGAETLNAEQATAILVATVREGKAGAETIAQALGRVLPVASQLGVSFDQVGASIAAMTRLGLDANESATALRSIMSALLKPSKQGADALEEVGLSFAGLRKQMKEEGLLQMLTTLKEKLGDDEEALAKIVPNVRGLTGVLNLVGSEGTKTQEIFASLANTTKNDLAKAFNVARKTSTNQFARAKAAAEAFVIRIGTVLLEILGPAMEFARETFIVLGQAIKGLTGDTKDFSGAQDIMVAVLKGVGFVVAAVVDGIRLMTTVVNIVREGWLTLNSVLVQNRIEAIEQRIENEGVSASLIAQRNALNAQVREIGESVLAIKRYREESRNSATATERWSETISEVEARLKNQRAAAEEAAKATAKVGEETRKAVSAVTAAVAAVIPPLEKWRKEQGFTTRMLSRTVQVAGEFAQSSSNLAARMAALPIALREWVKEGSATGAAFTRLLEAESSLSGKTDEATGSMDAFRLATREALMELSQGPQTAMDLANELAKLPEAARGFVLAGAGIKQMNDRLKQTKVDLKAAQERAEAVASGIKAFASAVADFVGQVLDKAFEGQIQSMKDVGEIAEDVLKSLLKSVIQSLVQLAVQSAITRAVAGAANGAVVQGGVVGSAGGSLPALAAGGIISGPGLFIAGEGKNNEAIVPLPDGRSIPVMQLDSGGTGGSTITNIFNVSAVDEAGVSNFFARRESQEAMRGSFVDGIRTDSKFRTQAAGGIA